MIFAAIDDGPYNVVYLLHLVAVILGTGSAFLLPMIALRAHKQGQPTDAIDSVTSAVMAPSLLAAGVFGGALVGLSDDVYDFGQGWLALGGVVWLVAVAAAALAYPPSYVRLPDITDNKAMISGVLHLSLVVMLVLMTWKFGT